MPTNTIILNGLKDIRDKYECFVMGLFGVVHDGEALIEPAKEVLIELKKAKKKIAFLSNTPLRSEEMAERLESIGIPGNLYDGILTSGEIAYHELKSKIDPLIEKFGERYYTIGSKLRAESLVSAGYTSVKTIDEADFIFLTSPFSDEDTIDMYNDLLGKALKRALPMICVNPNRTRRIRNQTQICAGYIAAKYERNGGMVIYKGKPDTALFTYCFEGLDAKSKEECLVIGDSFEMDILPAERGNLNSLLIMSGRHRQELKSFSRADLEDLCRHFGTYPTYAMKELVI